MSAAEIKEKIAKAKANKVLTDKQREQVVAALEAKLAALEPKKPEEKPDAKKDAAKEKMIYDSFQKAERKPDFPAQTKNDLIAAKKAKKEKKPKATKKYKGEDPKELNEKNCRELLSEVEERRKAKKKSDKKTKSKPVIEKIVGHFVTGATQIIKNIAAEDIKANPGKVIDKMKALADRVKSFLVDCKGILGDDYDKEDIDDGIKEIRDLIKTLEQKYK